MEMISRYGGHGQPANDDLQAWRKGGRLITRHSKNPACQGSEFGKFCFLALIISNLKKPEKILNAQF
jgi:hypothetical protein